MILTWWMLNISWLYARWLVKIGHSLFWTRKYVFDASNFDLYLTCIFEGANATYGICGIVFGTNFCKIKQGSGPGSWHESSCHWHICQTLLLSRVSAFVVFVELSTLCDLWRAHIIWNCRKGLHTSTSTANIYFYRYCKKLRVAPKNLWTSRLVLSALVVKWLTPTQVMTTHITKCTNPSILVISHIFQT